MSHLVHSQGEPERLEDGVIAVATLVVADQAYAGKFGRTKSVNSASRKTNVTPCEMN